MMTTKEDRDRYHWYQNAQNMFWQSPIWEVQTKFDEEFNEVLLDEIYGIGKDIVLGKDKDPNNSIWDYSRPNLDILKQEIIDIVTKKIVQNISSVEDVKHTWLRTLYGLGECA